MRSYKVSDTTGQEYDVEENKLHEAEADGFLPIVTNGQDTHRVSFSDLSLAQRDGFKPVTSSDKSALESGLRGAAQGISMGFGDEITGALESTFTDKTYAQARDESRKAYQEAQDANPITYGAGEIGGAIGSAFIPGLNIAKGATLGARAAGAAALGATAGLGMSEADLTKGDYVGAAKDTAIGGALGGALQYGGEKYIAPALKGAANYMSESEFGNSALKKLGKVMANAPEEHTERYLKNPEAVNNSFSREELAQNLLDEGGSIEQLREKVKLADHFAWKELDENTVIPKAELLDDTFDILKKQILNPKDNLSAIDGVGASSDKLRAITSEMDKIKGAYGDMISEADMKSIIQNLRNKAYSEAGSPKYTHSSEGLRMLAGHLDEMLKGTNKPYEELMVPVANMTKLGKDIERNYINKQDPESYDRFFQKLNKWNSADEASQIKSTMRDSDLFNGTSMYDDINNTLAKETFSKSDTQGSRKTMFGTVIGGAVGTIAGGPAGGVIGSAFGAGVGQVGDKYAGSLFKQILNGKIAADKGIESIAPYIGKYAKPLMEAAKRGNNSLAATHFLLQQTDPNYRKLMKDTEN